MSKAKSEKLSKLIADHSYDNRSLWKAFNKILQRCRKVCLLDHTTIEALANTFNFISINKSSIIRSSFSFGACSDVLNPPVTEIVLQNLTNVTDNEVRRLVLSAPCKSFDIDPVPTSLVKNCIDILVTPIA